MSKKKEEEIKLDWENPTYIKNALPVDDGKIPEQSSGKPQYFFLFISSDLR